MNEILDKWKIYSKERDEELEPKEVEDVDTKLARLMESKTLATVVQKQYTPEELKIREQILAQYSQVTKPQYENRFGLSKNKYFQIFSYQLMRTKMMITVKKVLQPQHPIRL